MRRPANFHEIYHGLLEQLLEVLVAKSFRAQVVTVLHSEHKPKLIVRNSLVRNEKTFDVFSRILETVEFLGTP